MLELQILASAAIVTGADGVEAISGPVGDDKAIPLAFRRRMARFERNAARCGLALAEAETDETIVLASRYGGMETALSLMQAVTVKDLLSPMDFALSVHNATPGLISQIVGARGGHTAVAAGEATLAAGLMESYTRIADGERVLLLFADMPLPGIYAPYDEDGGGGVALALRLGPGAAGDAAGTVAPGRQGARALARGLSGLTGVRFAADGWGPAL